MSKVIIDDRVYFTQTVTRIQEGASFEDIEDGNAYETAYIVLDENGECIWDTTNYECVRRYFEQPKSIEIIPMELEDYFKVKPENAWDYPVTELEYLAESIASGDRRSNRFALINNRLFELEEE